MYPSKHIPGVVTERRFVANELWIVRIRVENPIAFLPGQYLTIGLPIGEKLIERPYSVASDPRETELEFFLESVPGGKLSPHLAQVPVGGEVFIRPSPNGKFNFDTQSGHVNHFMVATVTGVAPFVSMMRNFSTSEEAASRQFRIALVHSASFPMELGYLDELAALADQKTWFQYVPTISRIWLSEDWAGERGRAEDIVRKYLDALNFLPSTTTVYLCGNPYMIRNVEAILERAGFPKESIKHENYWPAD